MTPTDAEVEAVARACPFCGGEADVDIIGTDPEPTYCVDCDNPECYLSQYTRGGKMRYTDARDAIAAWNCRYNERDWTRLATIQQQIMDEITPLWQKATGYADFPSLELCLKWALGSRATNEYGRVIKVFEDWWGTKYPHPFDRNNLADHEYEAFFRMWIADCFRCLSSTPRWRSISSAPKDGTHILGYDGRCGVMYRDNGEWWGEEVTCKPTHWQPLPAGPIS